MSVVRAEYDFEAQPNSGEMSISAGDLLTVIKSNVDGGWMEGRNVRGSVGLFPESYVVPHVPIATQKTVAPPSAPSASFGNVSSRPVDDWGTSTFAPPPSYPSSNAPLTQQVSTAPSSQSGDFFDDDDEYEDDDEDEQQSEHRLSVQDPLLQNALLGRASGSRTDMSTDDDTRSSNAHLDGGGRSARNGLHMKRSDSRERRRRRSDERGLPRRSEKSFSSAGSATKEHGRVNNVEHRISGNRDVVRSHSAHSSDRYSTKVARNINRFSNFVKSGMEAYILGETKMSVSPTETHEISCANSIVQWKPIPHHYRCIVDKPKKESKLKGLKSFIAYSISSYLTSSQATVVSRRYKHFDWLHEQLSAKYILTPIPPLPEKQMAGRYEEELIDHRMHILQLWVNKICRHPVLSQSEVWLHFLSCRDEREWKNGKRKAEKDEYVGGNFMNCLTVPTQMLDLMAVEKQVERFQKSVKTSEDAMRTMQERVVMFQKAYAGPVKQNWQKMGVAFKTLQQSFEIDETPSSRRLTEGLAHAAAEYHEIGNMFDNHTRVDMEPVVESLYSYKGTVQNVPDIINLHRQTIQKFRESEGRLATGEAEKMRQRVNIANYAMLAEMSHQTNEKVEEMKETMGNFLKTQADFYQNVANKLRSLSSRYE